MGGASRRSVLPGFGLTMGLTLTWLSLLILIPLAGLFVKTAELSPAQFIGIVTSPRTLHALKLSFGLAFAAASVNLVAGLVIVWALVRYRFPGRRIFDAIVDIPFALPTAVAGVALSDAVRPEGLARRAARGHRHQGSLYAARDFRRDDLHRHSVRGAHGATGADRSRRRTRGGGRLSRRQPLANRHAGGPAEPDTRDPDRFRCWRSPVPSANTVR